MFILEKNLNLIQQIYPLFEQFSDEIINTNELIIKCESDLDLLQTISTTGSCVSTDEEHEALGGGGSEKQSLIDAIEGCSFRINDSIHKY
jgi:hypothetical protein